MLAARDADERHPLPTEEKAHAFISYFSDPDAVPFND